MKKNRQIDITAIVKTVYRHKFQFIKVGVVALIIGVIVAFSIPKEYTTSVILAPESNDDNVTSDISSLASMVGVNLNTGNISDAFYPQIYPDIFASSNFIIPLWKMNVTTIDGTLYTSLYDYIAHHQKTAWWNSWRSWLGALMKHKNNGTGKGSKTSNASDVIQLTEEQENVTSGIRGMMKCDVDQKTDVITITVNAQDPLVATLVADSAQKALQGYITKYRTNKARKDLESAQKWYNEAKANYEKARRLYGGYADANEELVLQSFKLKQEDLENDMQLKYNTYIQLAQQLQVAKTRVQQKTPVFTVIQSASVPLKKSKPKRMIIILGFLVAGFLGTYLFVSYKEKKVKLSTVQSEMLSDQAEASQQ